MTVEFSSHRDGTYICLTGRGDISDAELISAIQLMYSDDEATKRHRCALIDFSLCQVLDISNDGVREAARLNVKASKLMTPGAAVAVVVSESLAYGLGRMWEAYADGTGWTTQIFTDLNEAEDWLEAKINEMASNEAR